MKKPCVIGTLFLTTLLTACSTNIDHGSLATAGMLFVGGQVEEGATAHSDQALVHFFKPQSSSGAPVVLYPGLGLSSYIYISTPDGRDGWAQQFARSGHDTYVFDPVNTGPSGFPAAAFEGESPATVATWNIDQIWPRWGFGEKRDEPYENVRFPIEHIDQFYASWSARLASGSGAAGGTRGGRASPENVAALVALLEQTGPAVLIPHSMGGRTVFNIANDRPDLVRGIVVIEPVGCPRNERDIQNWKHVPFLAVYGDYIDSRGQTERRDACRTTVELVNRLGGNAAMLELTEEGVFGNTHILMQENNSAEIGARILTWMRVNVESVQ